MMLFSSIFRIFFITLCRFARPTWWAHYRTAPTPGILTEVSITQVQVRGGVVGGGWT